MDSAASTAEHATSRLPPRPSQNGGPPAAGSLMPVLVLAAAFALGILLARLLDWRSHAHPHD